MLCVCSSTDSQHVHLGVGEMLWPLAEARAEPVQSPLCQRLPCSQGRCSINGQLVSKGHLAVREAAPCALCQKLHGRKDINLWAFQLSLARGLHSEVQGQVIHIFLPQ